MSSLQIIETLCGLLADASAIIRQQARLLEMHEITTADGAMEDKRAALLEKIDREEWGP